MVRLHQQNRAVGKSHTRSRRGFAQSAAVRLTLALVVLCSGCVRRDDPLTYPFRDEEVQYYKDAATNIEYPLVVTETAEPVAFSQTPHTVLDRDLSEPWDMPIMEAVHLALQNNDIIRTAGTFLSPGNSILANGTNTPSSYDPAITDSGVLFGSRGVEAALSAFDANFTTSMTWGRNEQVQNNSFFAGGLTPGSALNTETGNFNAGLRKDFAYGGQIQLNHTVNYLGSNAPGQLFPSNYTGLAQALYRQPLWAGAGPEFTRIAGPITQQFGGLSGVTQGVVIARINSDLSIADFEANIRNLVRDVEDLYWDLYLAYRNFDTAVTARNAALSTWRNAKIRIEIGGQIDVQDESQARDQYFAAQALVDNTRSNIFTAETRLRRLMGIPVNEGRVIRPLDEPITAEMIPDWQASLTEALVHRVELRKQKWNIKSLELQLVAARSLTKPRLDFVGGYQVNGFGDNLLGYNDDDGTTAQGLNNYYETLTQGNHAGWSLGFEFNMPIGFRSAHAQVRNIELRLAKAQQVLYAQELEVAHELAVAFQELARAYTAAQSQFNRRQAAIDNVVVWGKLVSGGSETVDEILRAQERRAQAEVAFFTAVIDYNKALTNYQFRKGTLLMDTNVTLMEGGWDPDAYVDAYRRAQARTAAIDAPFKHAAPEEFASAAPVGSVQFAQPMSPVPQLQEPPLLEELAPLPTDEMEATPPLESDQPQPADPELDSAALDWLQTPAKTAGDALLHQPYDADRAFDPTAPLNPVPPSQSAPRRSQKTSARSDEAEDAFSNVEPLPDTPQPIQPPKAPPASKPIQAAGDQLTPIGYWRAVN